MTERGIVSDGTHATTVLGLSDQYVYETVGSVIEPALYSNVIDEMEDSDPLTTTSPDFGDWEDPDGGSSTDFLSNGSNISDRSLRMSASSGDGGSVKTDAGGSIIASPSKIRAYFYIHQLDGMDALLRPQGASSDDNDPFSMRLEENNEIILSASGFNSLSGSWATDTLYRVDFTEITWGSSGTNVKMEVFDEDADSSLGSLTDGFFDSADGLEQLALTQFAGLEEDAADIEWYGFSYE